MLSKQVMRVGWLIVGLMGALAFLLPRTAAMSSLRAVAPETAPGVGLVVYSEPCARFTLTVPSGWLVQSRGNYALITDPDREVEAYVFVAEGTEPETAIPAWLVDAPWTQQFKTIRHHPYQPKAVIDYGIDDQGRVANAYSRTFRDHVYVIMIRADEATLEEHTAEIRVLLDGFTIKGRQYRETLGIEGCPPA